MRRHRSSAWTVRHGRYVDYSDARFEPNNTLAEAYENHLGPDESVIFSFARCHQTTATTCWWSDDCSARKEYREGQCMAPGYRLVQGQFAHLKTRWM